MKALLTIGHSTLSLEAFLRALREKDVRVLVDVRRYPGSRRYPQFGQGALFQAIGEIGVRGVWREDLGGRRTPVPDSVNVGWRNASFRGYADYMQTAAFGHAMDWLMEQAARERTTVMCAEAVPWRCHRSLIADAVLARGGEVEDLYVAANGMSHSKPHGLTAFARVEQGRVWYPALKEKSDLLFA